ncbi:hypothetical protein PESHB5_15910 [Pediococcus parvulus]
MDLSVLYSKKKNLVIKQPIVFTTWCQNYQQEHAKYHRKDKWGDNSYANVQHNLSTQRLALWDTNFDMTVNFFIRIGYALLGPIILMFDIVKDLM